MSKEYIERGALIARYDAEHVGPPGRARELITTAPAADVVEVVHGELTEHIRELLRAEKDGRLVVLPCKVGDELWSFSTYPTARVYGFAIENLMPSCRSCNNYKSSLTLEKFRQAIERWPEVLQRDNVTYRNAVRFGMIEPKPHKVMFYFELLKEEK